MSTRHIIGAAAARQAKPYELPERIQRQLEAWLPPGRGRDNAISLATFLGRFWSAPSKLGEAFHVDRRALADRPDLGLSEKQVRRALEALVQCEFLKPQPVRGSAYHPTEDGLRRKPILYRFGADWWSLFKHACRKAAATIKAALTKRWAQKEHVSVSPVYMGPPRQPPPEPNKQLEAALARLKAAAGFG